MLGRDLAQLSHALRLPRKHARLQDILVKRVALQQTLVSHLLVATLSLSLLLLLRHRRHCVWSSLPPYCLLSLPSFSYFIEGRAPCACSVHQTTTHLFRFYRSPPTPSFAPRQILRSSSFPTMPMRTGWWCQEWPVTFDPDDTTF